MPFLAFFSKRLYRDVGYNWKGANFAYLFLLLAICCLPATLHTRKDMLQSLETGQVDLINQIPEIQIRNGHVSTEKEIPYYINLKDGSPLAIVDTTGSMNYIDNSSTLAMLTETKLIVRYGPNHFNTFDLSGVENLNIDKHVVNGWFQTIKSSIAPLSYGIFLMLSYIFAVLVLLFVAIVGLVLSAVMHHPLRFSGALRIATVAATPAIIFISISAALGHSIPGAVYLAVTMIYLFVGIKSCSRIPDAYDETVNLKSFLHEDGISLDDAA
jgi:hypothetical protein